jgi:hypothetical protein
VLKEIIDQDFDTLNVMRFRVAEVAMIALASHVVIPDHKATSTEL